MNIPMLVDLAHDNPDWQAFAVAQFFALFNGISFIISCREDKIRDVNIKETFILTSLSWLALTCFASLPLFLSELDLSYTDAFFEAMSGLTTTGATIITDLEAAPPGVLVWRAILEWIGGIGIIVMAIAILPFLRIGGMQLFRTESSDKGDKIMPRAKQLSSAIAIIYVCLTLFCTIILYALGMNLFDAILHAMTTVSTGGFSTHNQSIGFFNSVGIELTVIIFILISSIPFPVHIKILRGKWHHLFTDHQVQFFFSVLVLFICLMTGWLVMHESYEFETALRRAAFNITSVMTTTGFTSYDYNLWGEFALTIMFLISVIGGCTGSTTGGIKIFRYQVLYKTARYQILKLIQPHGVFRFQYNGKSVSDAVSSAVMSFFILFCLCFFVVAILLALTGLDFVTSMSGAASALANLGPGLGDIIGPAGNYATINDVAKWILSFAMLIGRLEIFTIFVLISASFWRD